MSPFIRRASVGPTDGLVARSVLFIALAIYTATFVGIPENSDGELEFQTTSALARTGGLALGGTPEADRIFELTDPLGPAESPIQRGAPPREDLRYAWFGVGQAAVAVPFYYLGRAASLVWGDLDAKHREERFYGQPSSEYFEHLLVGWRNPLFGALTAWLVVLAARRLGAARPHAWIAGLSYALATFAWPQARSSLSDVQATFFLFLAFHLILRVRERFERLSPPRPIEILGIGAAIALAFLTRLSTVLSCAVLSAAAEVVLVAGFRRVKASRWSPSGQPSIGMKAGLGLFALPLVLGVAAFAFTNLYRFGSPWNSGYDPAVSDPGFLAAQPVAGLAGLLVSPGRGLLWMAPAVLLVPFGIRSAHLQGERLWTRVLVGVAIGTLVPAAAISGWHGAWTYGPRYLLPLLPFLWVGVGIALGPMTEHRPAKVAAAALFLVGFVVQLPAALVDHMTHQDLAVQAARVAWPAEESIDERTMEEVRFQRIQWSWGFAAPWAHWRIFRHRAAGQGEEYPIREVFGVPADDLVRPSHERTRGFAHLAWADHVRRLGGSAWPPVLLVLTLLLSGAVLAVRGLDPNRE